ncbi:MAG: hypothetical protein ACOC7M_01455 [Chloroflexota bacterium]
METRQITIEQVLSPGTVRGNDGLLYVLRGIPDVQEEVPTLADATAHVQSRLLNAEVLINEETAQELPDLPGMEVDILDTDKQPLNPQLAAEVSGILVHHPMP